VTVVTDERNVARPGHAGRPDASGGDQDVGCEAAEASFTALLRSDAVMLLAARRAMEDHGGGLRGDIAARGVLDAELQASSGWPTGDDYLTAAADYERAGREEDAAFLRRIGRTDHVIAAARTGWNLRYRDRPKSPDDELVASIRQGSLIEFDPAGPYLGIDGASYEPGVLPVGTELEPVVVVSGRGGSEMLIGWPDYATMSEWIATRGTTASGPLTAPPGHRDCRARQEDQLLARLVSSPSEAPMLAVTVPPDTFTTDVRYDLYRAIAYVAGGGGCTPADIGDEAVRRMAAVPAHGLARYGGRGAPFARAYLNRLAETVVDRGTALSAARALVQEDKQCRSQTARALGAGRAVQTAASGYDTALAAGPGRQPEWRRPEPPASGPVPAPRF
jgi:hypothetical protein